MKWSLYLLHYKTLQSANTCGLCPLIAHIPISGHTDSVEGIKWSGQTDTANDNTILHFASCDCTVQGHLLWRIVH
jgi:hypothetical protein